MAGATTTHYVYGAGGLLYGEYTSAGALVREYIWLDDAPLAQIDAGSLEVLTYLHTDHLGTPRYGTNAAGASVWSWAIDAFGVSTPTGTRTVNLRMPGQYYDPESGLFQNWNRSYNPAIGRYISSDPIGLAGGDLNVFSYVSQNPLMASDPEGKFFMVIPVGYVLFGGAAFGSVGCYATPACYDGIKRGADNIANRISGVFNSDSVEENENTAAPKPATADAPTTPQNCQPGDCAPEPSEEECTAEWEFARSRCSDILSLPVGERPPGIWGGSITKCIMGQVSQACGGNRVD